MGRITEPSRSEHKQEERPGSEGEDHERTVPGGLERQSLGERSRHVLSARARRHECV